ncbi:MAG TPA: hypothetical protein VFR18_20810, partial [Terriglobia bacterium]|nr:hypothetical protein [Terriglobia bacterium]
SRMTNEEILKLDESSFENRVRLRRDSVSDDWISGLPSSAEEAWRVAPGWCWPKIFEMQDSSNFKIFHQKWKQPV